MIHFETLTVIWTSYKSFICKLCTNLPFI